MFYKVFDLLITCIVGRYHSAGKRAFNFRLGLVVGP